MRTSRKSIIALGVIAVAGAGVVPLASPAAAQEGARASSSAGVVKYSASDGQANDVRTTGGAPDGESEAEIVIDDVVPITAGEGCFHPDEADLTRVTCTIPDTSFRAAGPYRYVRLNLGDMDDTAVVSATERHFVYGEAGNDVLIESNPNGNELWGGYGDDTLTGSDDSDWMLNGGWGNDTISGGGGPDHIEGQVGNDEIHGDVAPTDHRRLRRMRPAPRLAATTSGSSASWADNVRARSHDV
jgi:Ca2+-binding RTX toxin-like protein